MTHLGDRTRKAYDYKTVSEYPHAHRRNWPAKKARRHREERRHARQVVLGTRDAETCETLVITPVHREPLRAWGPVPMQEWISGRLEQRVARTGWNLLERRPYCPCNEHARRYAAVINAVTAGSDCALAEEFAGWLSDDRGLHRPVLRAVLNAQPALDATLRAWITRMTHAPK